MNNLSQREKFLVTAILAIVPVLLLYFGWTTYQSMRRDRIATIVSTEARKVELQNLESEAQIESDRLDVYNQASLPANVLDNTLEYQQFVWNMAESAGLEVKMGRTRRIPGETTIQFTDAKGVQTSEKEVVFESVRLEDIKLKGTLKQLTAFLHDFYDRAILHRVDSLVVSLTTPDKEELSDLSATLSISGAVLSSAPATKSWDAYPRGRLGKSLPEYEKWIVRRNIFGPPNSPPEITSRSSDNLKVGESISMRIEADDENDDDEMNFELVESSLAGATLTQSQSSNRSAVLKSGEVEKAGRHKFVVRVTDNGFPAMSDEQTLTINFEEPSQPKPTKETPPFKYAPETYITSLLQGLDGQQTVVLNIRPKGEILRVAVGKEFELDEQQWKVISMDRRTVTIQNGEKVMSFKIGSPLNKPEEKKADETDAQARN